MAVQRSSGKTTSPVHRVYLDHAVGSEPRCRAVQSRPLLVGTTWTYAAVPLP